MTADNHNRRPDCVWSQFVVSFSFDVAVLALLFSMHLIFPFLLEKGSRLRKWACTDLKTDNEVVKNED